MFYVYSPYSYFWRKFILMKFLFAFLFICITITGYTQYYYNDIVATQLSRQQYISLKNNNIKTVTAVSYESDNEITSDFKLQQQITPGAKSITIYTSHPSSGDDVSTTYYDNDKLVKTVDSSGNVVTTITYQYNANGSLDNILTQTHDGFMNSHSEELHQWVYNNGQPLYMLRIKDKTDTTNIEFSYDEQGNVAQENWKKKGRIAESYYYYYNTNKQLTDIVRYNNKAKKMLPDFLYEYDAEGRIIQMTQVPAGSNDYMVWKYVYNNKGLKQNELLFTKQNKLVGKIEYQYQ